MVEKPAGDSEDQHEFNLESAIFIIYTSIEAVVATTQQLYNYSLQELCHSKLLWIRRHRGGGNI